MVPNRGPTASVRLLADEGVSGTLSGTLVVVLALVSVHLLSEGPLPRLLAWEQRPDLLRRSRPVDGESARRHPKGALAFTERLDDLWAGEIRPAYVGGAIGHRQARADGFKGRAHLAPSSSIHRTLLLVRQTAGRQKQGQGSRRPGAATPLIARGDPSPASACRRGLLLREPGGRADQRHGPPLGDRGIPLRRDGWLWPLVKRTCCWCRRTRGGG